MFSSPVGGFPRGNEPDQNNINKTVEVTRKSDAPKSSLPTESRLQTDGMKVWIVCCPYLVAPLCVRKLALFYSEMPTHVRTRSVAPIRGANIMKWPNYEIIGDLILTFS